MKALLATEPGVARLTDLPDPRPGTGEVVVRVRVALTCGTDLKLLRRGHPKFPFPVILGHEFAGEVVAVGEDASWQPGDLVTAAVSAPCGECGECRAGRENLCPFGFETPVWGAFAEFIKVSARATGRSLYEIPDGLPLHAAALLDPLASVVRGVNRLPSSSGTFLIAGTGPVAFLMAFVVRHEFPGSHIEIRGRRTSRLEPFARHGFTTRTLEDGAGKGLFDAVIDTTGSPHLCSDLLARVARGGTLQLFAGMARDVNVVFPAFVLHYEEVNVMGSFHYRPAEAARALTLLSERTIPFDEIVTVFRPLQEYEAAFSEVTAGTVLKTALIP